MFRGGKALGLFCLLRGTAAQVRADRLPRHTVVTGFQKRLRAQIQRTLILWRESHGHDHRGAILAAQYENVHRLPSGFVESDYGVVPASGIHNTISGVGDDGADFESAWRKPVAIGDLAVV